MANTIITNQVIAKEFIRLSRNTNAFLMSVDRQYDREFERTGAVVGQSIRIRLPVDYVVRTGPTAVVQNSVQTSVTLTVASQIGVDMSFSSVDRTMNIDRFSENFIRPAVNVCVGAQATSLMAGSEGGVSNWMANQDANGVILPPVLSTWLGAKATLENNAVPTSDYKIVMAPNSQANAVATLAGLFNSQPIIAKQYESGDMIRALGFDWMIDQTVINHTTGQYVGSTPAYTAGAGFPVITVNGAGQSGSSLTVNALSGPLAQGDIIRVAGVFGVNPVNKASTGTLKTFAVTAPCLTGAVTIPIYPAITGPIAGVNQQFQTVTASPANAAQVYCVSAPGSVYRKNLAYVPKALTLASVDLVMPPNVEAAREVFDDTSIRVVTQYQGNSDQLLTRLDLLFGTQYLKPEWLCVVADAP